MQHDIEPASGIISSTASTLKFGALCWEDFPRNANDLREGTVDRLVSTSKETRHVDFL